MTDEKKIPKDLIVNESLGQEKIIDEGAKKKARFVVYKNLLVIGFSWIFLFTAYQSIASLQSSLNNVDGLGTASLSTIYVTLIVSCIFLPTIMIKNLRVKWTIFFSQMAYILYIGANIYPQYYTLIPTAIILGLGAAPLWTAKCAFLTDLGNYYSKFTGETSEVVINRFFGIFFAMFQTSQIWGNVISSTILKSPDNGTNSSATNDLSKCGVNDCPDNQFISDKLPPKSTVYTLCGIYVGFALIGLFLIFTLLDTYKQIGLESLDQSDKSPLKALINTVKHLKHFNQILIIPLTLWLGFEQAFIGADFTKSFITCIKSVRYVGVVMICYGVCDACGSYVFGFIMKYTGRIACIVLAAVLNYGCIALMIFYRPNADNFYVLFIIAVLWGIADSGWQTQINAFYGVIFQSEEEAAFSNFRLWESLGFAIAYAYSNYLCTRIKLYLTLAYLTAGIIGYGVIEFRLRVTKRKDNTITSF